MRLLIVVLLLAELGYGQFGGPERGEIGNFFGRVFGENQPEQQPPTAGFGRPSPDGNNNNRSFDLREQITNLMHNPNVQHVADRIIQGVSETINGISKSFFAPLPTQDGTPPHVLRRMMRFCTRNPQDANCQNRPDLVVKGDLPDLGGGFDLADAFPSIANFRLPPIPRLSLVNVLGFSAKIDQVIKNILLQTCANGKCKDQDPETLNHRASIAEREAALHRALAPSLSSNQIDQDIETRIARTHQLKQAVLRKAELNTQIDAKDDGVFQNDILLTEDQANRLINQIENAKSGEIAVGQSNSKHKRSAVYFEENLGRRWPANEPIKYIHVTSRPAGNFIYYSKWTIGGFCGLSHMGMKSPAPNLVYLSFNCGNQPGIALHETLHALGLNHEQMRGDRDQFVTIKWENVDPKQYDFFAVADSREFSSYGIKYAYDSIMHYNRLINTVHPGQPTMTAKLNPTQNDFVMGQRNGMSAADIQLVQKLYCLPADCFDTNVYCGSWASRDLCPTSTWLQKNCKKSCNLCSGTG